MLVVTGVAFGLQAPVAGVLLGFLFVGVLAMALAPAWLDAVSHLVPFRYLVDAVRAAFVGDYTSGSVAGWWLLVWYAGLALISYLGDYPEQKEKAGNLGVLDFNLGAVATLVLTGIVIWLALRCALPAERVREILNRQDAQHE